MLCHWYFLDAVYRYKPEVCNGCHDMSMMVYEPKDIAIMNKKGFDYRCITWNMRRSDTPRDNER